MDISIFALGPRENRRLVIASDFDDVWYDFMGRYTDLMIEGGYHVPKKLFKDWDAWKNLPEEVKWYTRQRTRDLYVPEYIRPHAVEVFQELHQFGDVYIVSSTMRHWADTKIELVQAVFGETARKRMSIMHEKQLFLSDCLIDDNTLNLRKYRGQRMGQPIFFDVGRAEKKDDLLDFSVKDLRELPGLVKQVIYRGM